MNPSTSNTTMETSSSHANVNAVVQINAGSNEVGMRNLQLTDADIASNYISSSMYKCQGVILQFICQNCPNASIFAGGMRLKVSDIRKVPQYLERYRQQICLHATEQLHRHLIDSQCSAGATEKLCVDDYSLTYSVASLSQAGRLLNPLGRHEGPLFYCLFPALLEETYLYMEADGTANSAYVLNAYLHLQEPSRRRNAVLKRAAEDEARKESGEGEDNRLKRQRFNQERFQERQEREGKIEKNLSVLTKVVEKMNAQPPPHYPTLPLANGIQWVSGGLPELPAP